MRANVQHVVLIKKKSEIQRQRRKYFQIRSNFISNSVRYNRFFPPKIPMHHLSFEQYRERKYNKRTNRLAVCNSCICYLLTKLIKPNNNPAKCFSTLFPMSVQFHCSHVACIQHTKQFIRMYKNCQPFYPRILRIHSKTRNQQA